MDHATHMAHLVQESDFNLDSEKIPLIQISAWQKAIKNLSQQSGMSEADLDTYIMQRYGVPLNKLSQAQGAALITDFQNGTISRSSIVSKPTMVNKSQLSTSEKKALLTAASVLEKGMKKRFHFRDGSISEGEILGIVGVSGNGQAALGRLLSGIGEPTSGTLSFYENNMNNINLCVDIGILKQIELDVLKLRFAIGVPKTLRQSEVAKELGITTGRVSQIEKKALTKLRNRIEIIE